MFEDAVDELWRKRHVGERDVAGDHTDHRLQHGDTPLAIYCNLEWAPSPMTCLTMLWAGEPSWRGPESV